MLAVDLHRRQGGRQRARSHDVLGPEAKAGAVEIEEVAGAHVDRADAHPLLAAVEAIPVHQTLQRVAQFAGLVIAQRARRPRGGDPRIDLARLEEAGLSHRHGEHGAGLIAQVAEHVAFQVRHPDLRPRHRAPECLQRRKPLLGRVAGDERRVDGADGDARDPVGVAFGLAKRLIDASLIGAQRAAALQHQRHPVIFRRHRRNIGDRLNGRAHVHLTASVFREASASAFGASAR